MGSKDEQLVLIPYEPDLTAIGRWVNTRAGESPTYIEHAVDGSYWHIITFDKGQYVIHTHEMSKTIAKLWISFPHWEKIG